MVYLQNLDISDNGPPLQHEDDLVRNHITQPNTKSAPDNNPELHREEDEARWYRPEIHGTSSWNNNVNMMGHFCFNHQDVDFEGATTEIDDKKKAQKITSERATQKEEVGNEGALIGPTSWYFNGRTRIFKTHLDILGALSP